MPGKEACAGRKHAREGEPTHLEAVMAEQVEESKATGGDACVCTTRGDKYMPPPKAAVLRTMLTFASTKVAPEPRFMTANAPPVTAAEQDVTCIVDSCTVERCEANTAPPEPLVATLSLIVAVSHKSKTRHGG